MSSAIIRPLARAISVPGRLSHRNIMHFPVPFWRHSSPIDRQFERMQREMDRVLNSPFWLSPFSQPVSTLDFPHLPSMIVNEDGVKKFRLDFDVSRFKPEEVRVKTSAADNVVEVEAKHEDDNCRYEFTRKIAVPKGTTIGELKCRFSSDGTLTLEAPFVPPPEEEPKALPKETEIQIEHK